MDNDKQQRRVKVTEGGTHRTGTRRAAIKPHKREEVSAQKIIAEFTGSLKSGSTSQTYWGATIDKNAAALRTNFGLAATDTPYLLLDPTGTGRAGMLLSDTGVHLADGRGGRLSTTWKELSGQSIAYQRNMLVIGQSGVASRDGQVLLPLLQQLQAKLGK